MPTRWLPVPLIPVNIADKVYLTSLTSSGAGCFELPWNSDGMCPGEKHGSSWSRVFGIRVVAPGVGNWTSGGESLR